MKYLCFLLLCSQTALAQWQLKKQIEAEEIQPYFTITSINTPTKLSDDCVIKPVLFKNEQPKGDTEISVVCKTQSGNTIQMEYECTGMEKKCYRFRIQSDFFLLCCHQ